MSQCLKSKEAGTFYTTHTHTHARARARAHTHARTHAHAHAHTHTHTQTHTHTHTHWIRVGHFWRRENVSMKLSIPSNTKVWTRKTVLFTFSFSVWMISMWKLQNKERIRLWNAVCLLDSVLNYEITFFPRVPDVPKRCAPIDSQTTGSLLDRTGHIWTVRFHSAGRLVRQKGNGLYASDCPRD